MSPTPGGMHKVGYDGSHIERSVVGIGVNVGSGGGVGKDCSMGTNVATTGSVGVGIGRSSGSVGVGSTIVPAFGASGVTVTQMVIGMDVGNGTKRSLTSGMLIKVNKIEKKTAIMNKKPAVNRRNTAIFTPWGRERCNYCVPLQQKPTFLIRPT